MVFLVLTRAGLDDLVSSFDRIPSPLWVNKGILSDAELAQLRDSGARVTILAGHIDPAQPAAVETAARTLQKHHAAARVWVEHGVVPGPVRAETPRVPARSRESSDWRRVLQGLVGRADDLFDQARLHWKKVTPFDPRLMIVPYLGYGTPDRLLLNGRVLRDDGLADRADTGTGWRNIAELYKRLASNEVSGARIRARFRDVTLETVTDREGYFQIEVPLARPLEAPGWHTVGLELLDPPSAGTRVRATSQVLVPPPSARFGVISDIDDTVVWTNVTNKLRMLLMLSRSNAYTRKPFKGVAAFYRALRSGVGGNEGNPIFYVSSSPWNLFTPLVEFMRVQGVPKGPLFLKDYGEHTLFSSRDHHSHKLASVERILQAYPHLPFILIGDSGEQDPEIYSRVVEMFPQRIRVIYIRNVNPDPSRIEAIDRLIEDVRRSGAQLVLAPDSEFAATHAAAEGLISPAALDGVRSDKREDEASADSQESVSGAADRGD